MKKALIAMSGGVDSSVAALLMQRALYSCRGVTMRLYRSGDLGMACHKTCCAEEDAEDAALVCFRLGMEHEVLDYTGLFRLQVMDRFCAEYTAGRTPNPCIDCNRYMKFDALLSHALASGFDGVATGHYARITRDAHSGRWQLRRALDESKDQSYVLYMLSQEQLAHVFFPLGELRKTETRALAQQAGLVSAAKQESQDICFIPDGDYGAFLSRWTGREVLPGALLNEAGEVVGRHRGAVRYTVGQRRGLGFASGERVYVTAKDMERNTVTVGPEAALYSRGLVAGRFNWLSIPPPVGELRAAARPRYRAAAQSATARILPDGQVEILFDTPQRALTPGQAVVLYDGDLVLGGGTIRETIKSRKQETE